MFSEVQPFSTGYFEDEEEREDRKFDTLQTLCAKILLSDVNLVRNVVQHFPSILIKNLMEEAVDKSRFLSVCLLMRYWPFEELKITLPMELKGCNVYQTFVKGKFQETVDKLSDIIMVVVNEFCKMAKLNCFEGKLRTLDLSEVPLNKNGFKKICEEIFEDKSGLSKNEYTIKADCHFETSRSVENLLRIMRIKMSGSSRIQLVVTGLHLLDGAANNKSVIHLLEILNSPELQKLSFGHSDLNFKLAIEVLQRAKRFHNLRTLEFSDCFNFSIQGSTEGNFLVAFEKLLQELVHVTHLTFHGQDISNLLHTFQSLNVGDDEVLEKSEVHSQCRKLKAFCSHPECCYTHYSSLQYMNLNYLLLTNEDILSIACGRHIKGLKHLILSGQSFRDHYYSVSLLLTAANSLYALEILNLHLQPYQIRLFLSMLSKIQNLRLLRLKFLFVNAKELLRELPVLKHLQHLKYLVLNSAQYAYAVHEGIDFESDVERLMKSFNRNIQVLWCF